MDKVIVEYERIKDIADSLRTVYGSDEKYLLKDMPKLISNIDMGNEPFRMYKVAGTQTKKLLVDFGDIIPDYVFISACTNKPTHGSATVNPISIIFAQKAYNNGVNLSFIGSKWNGAYTLGEQVYLNTVLIETDGVTLIPSKGSDSVFEQAFDYIVVAIWENNNE